MAVFKVKQNQERVIDFFNDKPYLDINKEKEEIDFCLGKNLKEAGEICKQIIQTL